MITLDLGNSRLKACRWLEPAARECRARWEGTLEQLDELERWLGAPSAEEAALASVAGAAETERVCARVRAHVRALHVAPPHGLENRCREPQRVGQDRLYAAAGAAALLGADCLVVDAGTALTVDGLAVSAGRASFLGGAIAPGPALGADALHRGTAGLPLVEPRPGQRALGTITEDAIRAGLAVGFRGAAAELVESVAREAELGAAPVVLTGGARAFLLEPGPFTARRLEVVPDLVHLGLLAAIERARDARERA